MGHGKPTLGGGLALVDAPNRSKPAAHNRHYAWPGNHQTDFLFGDHRAGFDDEGNTHEQPNEDRETSKKMRPTQTDEKLNETLTKPPKSENTVSESFPLHP